MFYEVPDDPAAAAMVMKNGAKEVARDTALHITLVSTVHEVRRDVTEAAVIHIWSKSKISGEIYYSYANYTRQNLFIDSDLKKPIRRKPKGAVAQAQGRIKRQLAQAQRAPARSSLTGSA